MNKRNFKITGLLFAVLFFINMCGNQDEIVAEFGKHQISLNEFRLSYLKLLKTPDTFDSRELREAYLQELINRRLLARSAEKLGYYDENLQYRVNAYRDKKLRDEHYKAVIKPKVQIEDEQVERVYQYMQESRHIRHLFAETRETADSLFNLLKQGASFDSLAEKIYNIPELEPNSGDLGWVNWDELDYPMAMAAFALKPGKISRPVRSRHGYHIIQVLDYKMVPLVSEQEFTAREKKTRYLAEYKMGDFIAATYLDDMMQNAEIKVISKIMQIVGTLLSDHFSRKPSEYDAMYERQLSEKEYNELSNSLWDHREETLAMINGKPLTVGEFISALEYVPYDILFQGFTPALDTVFRDVLLSRQAEKMNLHKRQTVRLQTNLYREYLLQLALRRQLVREVQVTDTEIRIEFEKNVLPDHPRVEFDSTRDVLKEQLLQSKKQSAVPNYIDSLRQNLHIKIFPEVIHQYYQSIYDNRQPHEKGLQS